MNKLSVEDAGGGFWTAAKRWKAVAFVVALALTATVGVRELVLRDGMAAARKGFEEEWREKGRRTQGRLENTFDLTYDALRTMAALPGVQRIERHGKGFEGDPKTTVQALYNNIAEHVAVSEIYIVPADMEPDEMDPVTGKLQEPIVTFDEIIVGKNADVEKAGEAASKIEEVEIYEYRQMKKQIAWYREHYPTRDSIKGREFPALSSEESITCDNSEFTLKDVAAHRDEPRKGIVYSVPFYDEKGGFKGLVSAIIRTRMFSRLLGEREFTLRRSAPSYTIHSLDWAGDEAGAAAVEYSVAAASHDAAEWRLACRVPESEFEAHAMMGSVRWRANMMTFTGVGITFPLAGLIWSLLATRRRAMELAGKMTVELRQSEGKVKAIIDGALDGVVKSDGRGMIATWNPRAQEMFGWVESEVMGVPMFEKLFARKQQGATAQNLREKLARGEKVMHGCFELMAVDKGGREFPAEVSITYPIEGEISPCAFIRDISRRKESDAERERLTQKLLDASRRAGMADVATGVLHNIGNVLTGVNVTASMIAEKGASPEVGELVEAAKMLRAHEGDIAKYLTEDEKGRHVPEYIMTLAEIVGGQNQATSKELKQLIKGIDHLKEIVRSQQQTAKSQSMVMEVETGAVVKEAIDLNFALGMNQAVDVVVENSVEGKVRIDKHKVLQVLVNLIGNAKQAMESNGGGVKRITIRVRMDGAKERILWEVTDTGMGIGPEVLPKMFQHGFTTKKEGHGFGLHSCANAATEMGGAMRVRSDGAGKGATFTLEIPTGLKKTEVTL